MSRYHAKVDANHAEIVKALRQCGATVQSLAAVGDGCPDLLVGYQGRTLLIEIKDGKGKLRPSQALWRQRWRGTEPLVVRTIDEAKGALSDQ